MGFDRGTRKNIVAWVHGDLSCVSKSIRKFFKCCINVWHTFCLFHSVVKPRDHLRCGVAEEVANSLQGCIGPTSLP